MTIKKNRVMFVVIGVVTIVVLFLAVDFYFTDPQLKTAAEPFSFSLTATPDNGAVIQGGNTTITVEAAYLDGDALPIALAAVGGPNGTIYQFSNQTGTPTTTQPFRSNLTIFIPASAASGYYLIDVLSNASAQTCQAAFNLTVVDAEIQVSGIVTIDSKLTIEGVILDVIPTDILFESNTTGQTYKAKVYRFTDTSVAPGKTGNYSISLPNQQSYSIGFYCFSYSHYIPVFRIARSGIENGYFTVDSGAGVNAIVANFTG